MEVKFKPRFWKDLQKLKGDRQLMAAVDKVFKNVDAAKQTEDINNIKQLQKFESRDRIKVFLDKKRDYRIGIYKHKNILWFARILHRRDIYEKNW